MVSQEFTEKTWAVVASVPSGRVMAYGQVAKMAGFAGYARQVGAVLKAMPEQTTLPWHRIVNASGGLSFPVGSEAYTRQRERLEREGVIFSANKIPKSLFWQPLF